MIPSLCTGGAERHVVNLCRSIDASEARISILLLRRGLPSPLAEELPPHVAFAIAPFDRRNPRIVGWVAGELRRSRAEVAHSFLWLGDAVAAAAACLLPRLALVVTERGDRSFEYHSAARRTFDRLVTYRRAQSIAANSEFGRSLVVRLGAPPERTLVLPNGVSLDRIDAAAPSDVRERFGWPPEAFIVACVARLAPEKGHRALFEAVRHAAQRADVRLVVAGDGPLRTSLEAMAAEPGLAGRIGFLGETRSVAATLKGADAAALLSDAHEHCSNSILEAMASGLPVIISQVGGNPELVQSGRNGWLVGPGDTQAAAGALVELAADPARARAMGAEGRRLVAARFGLRLVAHRHLDHWRALARAGQPRGAPVTAVRSSS
ncbi:MAG: glycosyltransferase [Gemmatimonadota bacterium]